ncbi:MAG: PAS domain S-box protein [Pirellulales bacterium]|nr:PAS domain S-box protein [Pirellulales bacterium]
MSNAKSNHLMPALAVTLSAAWLVAWAAGLVLDQGVWWIRIATLSVGLVLCATAMVLWRRRLQQSHDAVRRYLEALGRVNPTDFQEGTIDSAVPPLDANHPLSEAAARARQSLAELCEKLQELEHSRDALDIRYRRAASEHERIKSILSSLDDPIMVVDQFDEIVLANPSAESLLDIDTKGAGSRALKQLVRCENLVDLLTTTTHRKAVESRTDEIEVPTADGATGWYRVTAKKLVSLSEESDETTDNGAVAVLRDIAEKKDLQRRNAEFVSAVSHEMKTPLAGIKAYVELLADDEAEDPETREEFLEVIDSQATRLSRLVENLLNLARMEAGVVKVDKHARPLNEILEEALGVVRPSAEAKQITLVGDLSKLYLGVLADRDMLLQAAINLLSNAIKYTPDKGQVTLRSRMVDANVQFEVEDTGVGLSEEDAQRVFEKFYRVKKDQSMASGTGLGLPLAKHIVEDVHGGTLSVTSELGKGSTFSVTLPGAKQLS